MPIRRRWLLAAAFVATTCLTGCSESEAEPFPCDDIVRQGAYETLRQLAGAGLAADPAHLYELLPDGFASMKGKAVVLPDYGTFREQGDGEQAQAMSALRSRMTGVGDHFQVEACYSALGAEGACAGQIDH